MWDFDIGTSLSVLRRTFPFILLRMAVYFGITVAYFLVTGVGAGTGFLVGAFGDAAFQANTAFWGGALGFGAVSVFLYWVREYILYMVKAGHIALMVECLDGRAIPAGRGQFDHATAIVKARFAETNVLFVLDQLVKGAVRAISGLINLVASFLPIPGLAGLARFVNAVLRVALTYVDEVILAYNIRIRSDNPWDTSTDALVLFAQNSTTILKNAIWLAIFMYVFAALIFLLMLAPAAGLLYALPGDWSAFGFVLALIFAWSFKAALIEPFAIVSLMQVYFSAIEGQQPDPEWDERLSGASRKFRQLKDRAVDWARGGTGRYSY
jgi:hypothetical protein